MILAVYCCLILLPRDALSRDRDLEEPTDPLNLCPLALDLELFLDLDLDRDFDLLVCLRILEEITWGEIKEFEYVSFVIRKGFAFDSTSSLNLTWFWLGPIRWFMSECGWWGSSKLENGPWRY